MAKTTKNQDRAGSEIIENPILSNFKEGFISFLNTLFQLTVHVKVLADTALKTADAGYLTRRLCLMYHRMSFINEEDCGTLRGTNCYSN